MNWRVALSDIDLGQEEIDAVTTVLQSRWITMGEVTLQFENEFAKMCGAKHAYAVANGTAALHVANQVLGITNGDEVICPALTFVATANATLYAGGKPVFADVTSENDFNIDPEDIRKKITPKTKAITVVHYAGYPCNMDAILDIAEKHNLHVIEDAAHAPGATFNGKKLGTVGDIGCYSFFPNKNMTTAEGGMIVTDNDELADRIKTMRSHGMTSLTWDRHKGHSYSYDIMELGYNYRIDELRSAIGLAQLKKLESNNIIRANLVDTYRASLVDVDKISIPFKEYKPGSSHHIFPILLQPGIDRLQFIDQMRENGIQTSIHYPPIHLFSFYREQFGYKPGILPKTEDICQREVTLPLYPTMGSDSVKHVCQAIKSILN